MHGGGVTLARRLNQQSWQPDLLLVTDMLDLTTFLALTRTRTADLPVALFMHENQLTYPLPQDGNTGPMRRQHGERDLHYVFINYASMMAADHIFFNSRFHHDTFFAALPNFLKHFPEYNELGTIALLKAKSSVLPVGVDFERLAGSKTAVAQDPPLILWNQRWEYDKNPAAFFQMLYTIREEGIPFRLALCGQQYGKRPSTFERALTELDDQIVHVGYADEDTYRRLLWQADVTVSTAHHEFFGISILEAIYCHTFPILPHRLSYPELLPERFHPECLYETDGGGVSRLRRALTGRKKARETAAQLATAVSAYGWPSLISQYDQALIAAAESR